VENWWKTGGKVENIFLFFLFWWKTWKTLPLVENFIFSFPL
jgi:hypothetical protein